MAKYRVITNLLMDIHKGAILQERLDGKYSNEQGSTLIDYEMIINSPCFFEKIHTLEDDIQCLIAGMFIDRHLNVKDYLFNGVKDIIKKQLNGEHDEMIK
jgi:hypothetical protein